MLVSVDGLESGQVMYRKTIASFSKNFGGFYDAVSGSPSLRPVVVSTLSIKDALVRYYKSLPADYLPLVSDGVSVSVLKDGVISNDGHPANTSAAAAGEERNIATIGDEVIGIVRSVVVYASLSKLVGEVKGKSEMILVDVVSMAKELIAVVSKEVMQRVQLVGSGDGSRAGELVTVQEVEVVMTLVVKQHARLVVHLDAVAVLEQVVVGEREHGVDVEIQKVASVMEAVKGQEQEQEIIVMGSRRGAGHGEGHTGGRDSDVVMVVEQDVLAVEDPDRQGLLAGVGFGLKSVLAQDEAQEGGSVVVAIVKGQVKLSVIHHLVARVAWIVELSLLPVVECVVEIWELSALKPA
ncbi:hypothetical protein Pcac1_g9403 [Phytophthora cactorum]|nr:hypothetical protein Pcac1_g9403 [Phytophthora cactorum]